MVASKTNESTIDSIFPTVWFHSRLGELLCPVTIVYKAVVCQLFDCHSHLPHSRCRHHSFIVKWKEFGPSLAERRGEEDLKDPLEQTNAIHVKKLNKFDCTPLQKSVVSALYIRTTLSFLQGSAPSSVRVAIVIACRAISAVIIAPLDERQPVVS
jgi:hypothetical protein